MRDAHDSREVRLYEDDAGRLYMTDGDRSIAGVERLVNSSFTADAVDLLEHGHLLNGGRRIIAVPEPSRLIAIWHHWYVAVHREPDGSTAASPQAVYYLTGGYPAMAADEVEKRANGGRIDG